MFVPTFERSLGSLRSASELLNRPATTAFVAEDDERDCDYIVRALKQNTKHKQRRTIADNC